MTERRLRGGRAKMAAGGIAAALVLIVALVLVRANQEPAPLDRLPDPPAGPAQVTAGPVTEKLPETCAVSAATVERLVRDPRMRMDGSQGTCEWAPGGDGEERRYLTIGIEMFRGAPPEASPPQQPGRTPVSAAMTAFAPKWSDVPARAVTGLGDEALAQISPSAGATVVARVGNAKVTVQYRDVGTPLSERAARDGAFAAAAEAVAGLGARGPARPALAPAPRPAPARTIPDLCASVSDGTLSALVEDGARTGSPTQGGALGVEGGKSRRCIWSSTERELEVSVTAMPDTELIEGPQQATRQYEMRYLDAHAEKTLSTHDEKRFLPVKGLGDQAFATHVPDVVPATVVFREGDLLAEVTYTGARGADPLDGRHALRGAYAAAQDLAKALPTP
ncbi:hypothetical protein [Actinomadura algeriensis]|uniref:DUF3558 domain-containing protein n=1 Tax=Actinomadura algeriensis TaxID=1679523 RepID=A0ABR9JMV8_9ACTN|nr:hypothetical protein [Actinomadura algeriensis]MBE1531897.1 hypothetical protein [Actinomadura algeriensis]